MISIVFEMFDDLCLNASLIMLPCDHDYIKKYTRGRRIFFATSNLSRLFLGNSKLWPFDFRISRLTYFGIRDVIP